jgi:hypothetical protein
MGARECLYRGGLRKGHGEGIPASDNKFKREMPPGTFLEWSGKVVQEWHQHGTSMLVNMPKELAQKMQVRPSAEL